MERLGDVAKEVDDEFEGLILGGDGAGGGAKDASVVLFVESSDEINLLNAFVVVEQHGENITVRTVMAETKQPPAGQSRVSTAYQTRKIRIK